MSCNSRECQSERDKLKNVIRELQRELARYEKAYGVLLEHVNLSRTSRDYVSLTKQDVDDHARARRDLSYRVTRVLHDKRK